MQYSSLEDFIKAADAIGEVEYVEGADLERDVGCLTALLGERGGPMPVFDSIPGYPAGYRVCSNTIKSMRRFCLALDLPLDIHPWNCCVSGATSAKPPRSFPPRSSTTDRFSNACKKATR